MNPSLTAEAAAQLLDGINLVLSRWAALRIAVENEWGGRNSREKPQQLGDHLFNLLTQSKERVYFDDLEELLDDFMLSLNTEVEDGSIGEVAEKLMVMHEECLEGNFDSIKKLRGANTPPVSCIRQRSGNDEEDSEDDDVDANVTLQDHSSEMEVDNPQCVDQNNAATDEPTVKEVPQVGDGWTVVSSRRSRGRKN